MTFTFQDILFLVGALCLVLITVYLCWALYEIARLVRQANAVVTDTRHKVERFEHAIVTIGEKMGASAQYLGFIAEGGKQLLSFLHDHKRDQKEGTHTQPMKKEKSKPLSEMPEEET